MRARSILMLIGFLGFTVSCAHKPTTVVDEGQKKDVKVKIEKTEGIAKKQSAYTCLVGKDQRTVILDRKEKRCEVNYTKFGDIQQVAWAESTPSICDRAFNSIRSNIEGSGFKCQDGDTFKADEKKAEDKKPLETAATTPKK